MLETKYPIVLVHGMGVRDRSWFNSWGRVPKLLRQRGCRVFHGGQDANGAVADNALVLKNRILEVLRETGSEKVNVIAHSKGGLDIRYMISHLDMGGRVASLTTISTPHHGSKTVDVLLKFPAPLVRFGSKVTDLLMRLGGDKKPRTYDVIWSFTTAQAAEFNRRTPDDERVYYQSYGFIMKYWHSDLLMLIPYLVVKAVEGPNDGLLAPGSVPWGAFRGVYTGNGRRGISHCDEIDLRRHRLTKKQGQQISDMAEFYIGVVTELGAKGF